MRPGTDGVEIHPSVAPADGEPVIEKDAPNGFLGTDLEDATALGRAWTRLVVAGHGDVHVRRRHRPRRHRPGLLAHGGPRRLRHLGPGVCGHRRSPGATSHAAFIAALAAGYAEVVGAEELTSG